jgi:ribosomal protein S18 acetylase RimI-like enzyme
MIQTLQRTRARSALCIRPAIHADLDAIVDIHLAAFLRPDFTLSALGRPFLRPYYELIMNFEPSIFFVAEWENEAVGFVGGFLSPRLFYQTLKAAKWQFLLTLLWAIVKNPLMFLQVIGGMKRIKRNTRTSAIPDDSSSHLCSLAVRPSFSNRGIGKALVREFNAEARRRSVSLVVLTTDADNNEAVNAFYRRLGFRCAHTYYRARGRLMNEYVLQLEREEATQPIVRAA